MADWSYGDAGDRIPVQPGDIWRAGPHRFGCGDLQAGAADVFLAALGELPKLCYTDPPWNAGLARGFRTKAGVSDGPVNFPALLDAVMLAACVTDGPIFIEGSNFERQMNIDRAEAAGLKLVHSWPITYFHKAKNQGTLFEFSWSGSPRCTDRSTFSGMDDDDTPGKAIRLCLAKGELVIDYCTGRGGTCRAAAGIGRRFAGLELHPRRMAVALDWLDKQGMTPERVTGGTLPHPGRS